MVAESHSTQELPRMLPRERALTFGMEGVNDAELIALVLGSGARRTDPTSHAHTLIEEAGGLATLGYAQPSLLEALPGMDRTKALRLVAAFELGRRANVAAMKPRVRLSSSAEVAAFARARFGHLAHEEMWLLTLDGLNGARSFKRVAQGGLHGCSVSCRDILRAALVESASAIVLVHNHPSGDPTPSPEDISMSRAVADAAEIVGVALVDHVVIARAEHSSLLDLGLLP
jgi:DNA repair protein RadC